MSISRPDCIPRIMNLIWETNPKSILDVGVGFGGIGVLFREVTDIRWGRMKEWHTVIHGIEINQAYRNPIWDFVYDDVIIGNALDKLPIMPIQYDIIYLGDILEHLEKKEALELLRRAIDKSTGYVVISTPVDFHQNKSEAERFNNRFEEHKCVLEDNDFPKGSIIEQYKNQKLVIIKK